VLAVYRRAVPEGFEWVVPVDEEASQGQGPTSKVSRYARPICLGPVGTYSCCRHERYTFSVNDCEFGELLIWTDDDQ
jgi:hypothetical protein